MRVDLPSSTEPQVLKRRMSIGALGAEVGVERTETDDTAADGAEEEGAITMSETKVAAKLKEGWDDATGCSPTGFFALLRRTGVFERKVVG